MYSLNNQDKRFSILIVDDEPLVRRSLSELLALEGYGVTTASNGQEALAALEKFLPDVVITDVKMPDMDGVTLLKRIRQEHPGPAVIVVTGFSSVENAVEAMKHGAFDYIMKPVIDSEIKMALKRLTEQKELRDENKRLKEQVSCRDRESFMGIVGREASMQKMYRLIEVIASTRSTVLINGESGTGKHVLAHAIHEYDEHERTKPFVEVSCGALTETLLESELFGHVKGAFTGAIRDKKGRFELADGGTIFLDEIDAFPPSLQVKLLRVLQEGEFERVGESTTIKVDVRVIAASNQNLLELIKQGKFRKDLYYRLNIIAIEIPPLRERKNDIPLLAQEFIRKHSHRFAKKVDGLSPKALEILASYSWPGNIRELENVIERAVILSKGPVLSFEDFPEFVQKPSLAAEGTVQPLAVPEAVPDSTALSLRLKDALKDPERDLIMKALDSVDWNRNEAARTLGINRTTLYKKMLKYGLLKTARNNRFSQPLRETIKQPQIEF